MKVRYENLDDYRHEIEDNRRDIDVYKDGVVNIDFNIDFNSREENNNSNCDLNRDYNCNRKISIINNYIRKTSIVSIIKRKRESNNKNICACKRGYTNYGIYNYERGVKLVRHDYDEVPYIDCANIKSASISVRSIHNIRMYNYKRGATTDSPRRCYK